MHQHAQGNLFSLPEIYHIYQNSLTINPVFVHLCNSQNEILGLALGEISSLFHVVHRTTFYAEPLYNGDLNILDHLLQLIKNKSKGVCIEIRPRMALTNDEKLVYIKNGFLFHDHLNALLPLLSRDVVWNELASDKQQGILDAQHNGISIVEHNTIEGVDLFYHLVETLYKRKRRVIKPKSYFLSLLSCQQFHFLFAYYQGKPIATQLYYEFGDTITAYYTATQHSFLNKHAGDLLIWELIERGLKKQYKYLDLGGGGKPNRQYGVRDYKKRFNAQFENIGRFVYSPFPFSSLTQYAYKHY